MVLNALVKYWCFFFFGTEYWCFIHYHKCKVEYIELRMIKVVLIRVMKGKKY